MWQQINQNLRGHYKRILTNSSQSKTSGGRPDINAITQQAYNEHMENGASDGNYLGVSKPTTHQPFSRDSKQSIAKIDEAENEAAISPLNELPKPTEAQMLKMFLGVA